MIWRGLLLLTRVEGFVEPDLPVSSAVPTLSSFYNLPSQGIERKYIHEAMEYYNVYLLILFIWILAGVVICGFFCFRNKTKKDLLDEQARANELHSIRFACALRNMLCEKSNTELYIRLSCLGNQYKIPDPEGTHNFEEIEATVRELDKLDDYLSVLELCCSLIKDGALTEKESISLLGKRLESICNHEGILSYIKNYGMFYKNLLWELEQEKQNFPGSLLARHSQSRPVLLQEPTIKDGEKDTSEDIYKIRRNK